MDENRRRVLLVDDDSDDYLITKDLLSEVKGVDFELEWVSTYEGALEAIERDTYDVHLLDYHLGMRTGLELIREMIGKGCKVPMILLTGQGDHDIDIEAMRSGAADFLVKGKLDSTILERSIRYAIERKRAEEQILRLAYYDHLTNLPNRVLFLDRLNLAIAKGERTKTLVSVLFLDLDNFKRINDTLGHSSGDLLLKEVAERLTASLRKTDSACRQIIEGSSATVARLGGDEFTILLNEIDHFQDAARVAKRILDTLSRSFLLAGHEIIVTASIGIAIAPNDGHDFETLLKNADAAMYHAKSMGKNNYQYYERSINAAAIDQLSLEYSLYKALERKELVLYYQPQMNLSSGKIVGLEALLRWKHQELGLVSPVIFMQMAEETGLIVPIGDWVLLEACKQNKAWQETGFEPIRVSVNMSAKQFMQASLINSIAETLNSSGLDPQYLELEITESLMMHDIEAIINMLGELKNMGLHISIDDFGTGFSSFSYLKRLPIDAIKIDRSFVMDITKSPEDASIVSAIIAMAHILKLNVIAEGVESPEQQAFLVENSCDEMQGFLLSRPVPAEDVPRFLNRIQ